MCPWAEDRALSLTLALKSSRKRSAELDIPRTIIRDHKRKDLGKVLSATFSNRVNKKYSCKLFGVTLGLSDAKRQG